MYDSADAIRAAMGAIPDGPNGNMGGRPRFSRRQASVFRDLVSSDEAVRLARSMLDHAWYGEWPATIVNVEYPRWKAKQAKRQP